MKALLILGAGVMQGPAIRIARSKGYRVIVADGDPRAPLIPEADEFLHIDLKNLDALAAAAATINGLVGVFTAGTDFSTSVAWIANALGLPGIPYDTALDASDKARMRARLAASGVPVPRYACGAKNDDPVVLASRVAQLPLVVKPVDNMGSRGCRLARSESELREAWVEAVGYSRSGRAIVEEYLRGPEFSLDAVVYRGEVVLRGVADRIVVFEPYFVEMGHTMPSAYDTDILNDVMAVFKAGVAALGIRDGTAKGDIKYTRNGAYVGEIAARLSGGYMSGWTYPYSSGIEATAEAIDIACGLKPALAKPSLNLVCAERAWLSIPGRVAEVRGLEAATGQSGVRHVFSRVKAGDSVVFPSNNVEKCGNVIAVAADRIRADAAAEGAARTVLVRLAAAGDDTAAFLRRAPGTEWIPDAFSGLSALTLASVETMPGTLRTAEQAGLVSIAPLRGVDGERAVDWQGRSIAEALEAVAILTGATVGTHGDTVLGAVFWRAFFRGGYQAGAWIVDTVTNYGLGALP